MLFGATGDLSHRKLLPGLFRLTCIGFIPAIRIIGVSLEDIDAEAFRKIARQALDEFATHKVTDADWQSFEKTLDYVPIKAGAAALKAAGGKSGKVDFGREPARALSQRAAERRVVRGPDAVRGPASWRARGSSWRSRSAPT